MFHVNDSYNTH